MKYRAWLILLCWFFASTTFAQETRPDGYQYVFPGPGALRVHPASILILRFESISPEELTNQQTFIRVTGNKSGSHPGKTQLVSDGRTLIFTPERPFEPGEEVVVHFDPDLTEDSQHRIVPWSYVFVVLEDTEPVPSPLAEDKPGNPGQTKEAGNYSPRIMPNGVSVPSDFPHVHVTIHQNPSEDYIFLNNWDVPNYNIIFNTMGEPVWYWKTADRRDDFKVQANGWITMFVKEGYGGTSPAYIALDQDFEYIKSMRAGNGYLTDDHDFFLLPDSGYLLIGSRETMVDMSQYVSGGKTDAIVRETCIQEFTADDQLIFLWRAWDHFDIQDLELESLTGSSIRFPHINAVYIDEDGHILISSRHLSEVSKIHRQSGEFIWRMSGTPDSPNNEFQFERDPMEGFRNQHAIRSLGNNTYSLFDNGNLHVPPTSRAVEYEIDTLLKTATLIQEHRSEYHRGFISHMGNSQRLSNGNTHINWAYGTELPIATEVTPEGETLFEMWYDEGDRSYRTFRHPWNGTCSLPYLLLEPRNDGVILIFNKFGDDKVDYYNIYGGTTPHPGSLIDTSVSTLKYLTELAYNTRYYFRVSAVDKQGAESGYSNEEDLLLRDMEPGTNLIINGDFSDGLDEWIWEQDSTASAEVLVMDSVCHLNIEDGGSSFPDVQLLQKNIPLIRGQEYLLEFDAWSDETRVAEVILGADHPPYTDYSRLSYTALDPVPEKYSYFFVMNESTDLNARVLFNAGVSSGNIHLDNISLKIDASTNLTEGLHPDSNFQLYPNYPNPFSSGTVIKYVLPEASKVTLHIYNALGQKVAEYITTEQMPGSYSREIDLGNCSSGIYYYTLVARVLNSAKCYQLTKRMVLLQ